MNIRHLQYLVALAREKHFGRAAERAHVTQPTLSEAIRQLEAELRVQLVERGVKRFRDFTPEGKRVVEWAQRILTDVDSMGQELGEMREGLHGHLRLGVIPAAMPAIGFVTGAFNRQHPRVTIEVRSHTSIEIQRGLDEFELEAGITYLDNEPLRHVRTVTLYKEHYVLLSPKSGPFRKQRSVTWQQAATVPLCLLTPDMQNRRILNDLFAQANTAPRTTVETNSLASLLSHVLFGGWSTVVPHTFLSLLGGLAGMHVAALTPAATRTIGLVVADREPPAPLARAMLAIGRKLDLATAIKVGRPNRLRL